MSTFIKVTPKGEQAQRYVRASLKPFYLSQGAKVEPATEEEFYAAEPAERFAGSDKNDALAKQAERTQKDEGFKSLIVGGIDGIIAAVDKHHLPHAVHHLPKS